MSFFCFRIINWILLTITLVLQDISRWSKQSSLQLWAVSGLRMLTAWTASWCSWSPAGERWWPPRCGLWPPSACPLAGSTGTSPRPRESPATVSGHSLSRLAGPSSSGRSWCWGCCPPPLSDCSCGPASSTLCLAGTPLKWSDQDGGQGDSSKSELENFFHESIHGWDERFFPARSPYFVPTWEVWEFTFHDKSLAWLHLEVPPMWRHLRSVAFRQQGWKCQVCASHLIYTSHCSPGCSESQQNMSRSNQSCLPQSSPLLKQEQSPLSPSESRPQPHTSSL